MIAVQKCLLFFFFPKHYDTLDDCFFILWMLLFGQFLSVWAPFPPSHRVGWALLWAIQLFVPTFKMGRSLVRKKKKKETFWRRQNEAKIPITN